MKIQSDNLNQSINTVFNTKGVDISGNQPNNKSLLEGESAAVIAGAKVIEKNGYVVDEESLSTLRKFMAGDSADVESKLEAIDLSLKKDMPLKESLLSRLRSFSNKSLLDFLEIAPETTDIEKDIKNKNSSHYKKTLVERTNSSLEKLFAAIDFKEDLDQKNIENAINKKESILSYNNDDTKTKNFLNDTEVYNSKDLLDDKEPSSKTGIQKELEFNLDQKIIDDLKTSYKDESEFNEDMMRIASYLGAVQNINEASKVSMLLETKITPKLAELKNDFDSLKLDLYRNMYRVTQADNPITQSDKVELLSQSIEKLDSAIMKSEMSLYIDLRGERELIKISSDLQIAKDNLNRGDYKTAEKILNTCLKILDKLEYNPSIKKAIAIVNLGKGLEEPPSNLKEVSDWILREADRFSGSEKSISSLTHYLRKMGINTEVEQFENMLKDTKTETFKDFKGFLNLKTLVTKIVEKTENSLEARTGTSVIEHIDGTQLRNKVIDSKEAQTLALEIPLKLNGAIKNVKVFISSPQKMLKLDWENFDMFFVLTTKKLGEVGIRVKAVQRNLKVNIINDRAKKLREEEDFSKEFKKDVEEFGFNLVKMVLKAWNEDNTKVKSEPKSKDPYANKDGGFDIKI